MKFCQPMVVVDAVDGADTGRAETSDVRSESVRNHRLGKCDSDGLRESGDSLEDGVEGRTG